MLSVLYLLLLISECWLCIVSKSAEWRLGWRAGRCIIQIRVLLLFYLFVQRVQKQYQFKTLQTKQTYKSPSTSRFNSVIQLLDRKCLLTAYLYFRHAVLDCSRMHIVLRRSCLYIDTVININF